jgi:cytochrome P450
MGASNRTDHVRVQRVLKRYFTPRTIAALRPRIQAIAAELVDDLAGRRDFEAMADLAYPLPARVIAELLGVPAADRDMLPRWSRDQQIYLMVGAGNRDPDRWPDPDRFDATRPAWPNLAFGHGSFYCLGAALARVEAQVCFGTLFRRVGDLALHPDGPTWRPIPPLNRALTRLPVTVSPPASPRTSR